MVNKKVSGFLSQALETFSNLDVINYRLVTFIFATRILIFVEFEQITIGDTNFLLQAFIEAGMLCTFMHVLRWWIAWRGNLPTKRTSALLVFFWLAGSIQIALHLTDGLRVQTNEIVTSIGLTTASYVIFLAYSQIELISAKFHSAKYFLESLESKIDSLQGSINSQIDKTLDDMRAQTIEAFAENFAQLKSTSDQKRELLRLESMLANFQNEIVRPISRRFTSELVELEDRASYSGVRNPLAFPEKFSIPSGISIPFMAFMQILFVLGQVAVYGSTAIPAAIVTCLVEMSLLFLIRYVVPKKPVASWFALSVILSISFIASLISTVIIRATSLGNGFPPSSFLHNYFANVQLSPLVYLGIAYTFMIRQNLANLRNEKVELEQEFRQEEQRFTQRISVIRKRWAYFLHGTIQSALNAALMRLQASDQSPEAWRNFEKEISDTENLIYTYQEENINPVKYIDSLKQMWAGVVNIEFHTEPFTLTILASDQTAAYALAKVWRETVSNAVRHGQAKNIWVSLDLDGEYLVTVISNDGNPISGASSGSMGTLILDDLTTEWWFDQPPNRSGLVEVHCRLIFTR